MAELRDIIGQEQAISRLGRYLRSGMMPHAMLFAGPAGVGRRTTAVALARMLLCEGREDESVPFETKASCGKCEACRMMTAGSHPDFHLIYKELARYHEDPKVRSRVMQDLGIPVIRSFLIAPASRSAARGRGKVFVVLEAELLSIPAQNALLKTLEEPPEGTTIILVCSKPDRLLATTLSRCAMLRFSLLPHEFVSDKLKEAGVEEAEARFWAAFTDGSIGRGLSLARQGMYELKRKFVDALAAQPPGGDSSLSEQMHNAAEKLAKKETAEVKKADDGAEMSKELASRRAIGAMLELIASAYRDAMALAAGADRPLVNNDQRPAVEAIAAIFRPEQIAEIIQSLSRSEQLLWRNANRKIVWDNVVISCATATPLEV